MPQFPTPEPGFLKNCRLMARNGEAPLFWVGMQDQGFLVMAYLDGYTIIPNERMDSLKAGQEPVDTADYLLRIRGGCD